MKRKPLSKTVHPDIAERAKQSHDQREQEPKSFIARWLRGGRDGEIETVQTSNEISLETSTLMVEAASILAEFDRIKEK